MIGAMIAMPFSPLRTKRLIVRHVWKPATRVARALACDETRCAGNTCGAAPSSWAERSSLNAR